MRLARLLYTLIYTLLLPLIVLRTLLRSRKAPAYRQRLSERFGLAPKISGQVLWIHAVSVGETVAIAPLVQRLRQQYPEHKLLMTTMTPTGAERVQSLFHGEVLHRYCPWDHPLFWSIFLRRVRPKVCVIVETELWPNMLAALSRSGIPSILANARLSERSARGYNKVSALSRPMLQRLTSIAAQDQASADRFLALGVAQSVCTVTGSIKFDLQIANDLASRAQQLRAGIGQRPVLIAGSTHEGEDEIVLRVWKQLCQQTPDLMLILVPRHPERFDSVAQLAKQYAQQVQRRSLGDKPDAATQVFIGDSMGELLMLYALADIAFVGGSFSGTGGHNPLEPAALGKPIVMGPDTFNFEQITQALIEHHALRQVDDEAGLLNVCEHWLADEAQRVEAGAEGEAFVKANRGALQRLEAIVSAQID